MQRHPKFHPLIIAGVFCAALAASPALAQSGAAAPTTPAEIQPGHPAPATTGSTGQQSATPAPLPSGADTPGGSARNGVIAPPATAGDSGIHQVPPNTGAPGLVIPPPGSTGTNPAIVPK